MLLSGLSYKLQYRRTSFRLEHIPRRPLCYAALNGNVQLSEMLLLSNAEQHSELHVPPADLEMGLLCAVYGGSLDVIRLVLHHLSQRTAGASKIASSHNNIPHPSQDWLAGALQVASRLWNVPVVELLLANGADADVPCISWGGRLTWDSAIEAALDEPACQGFAFETIKSLVDWGGAVTGGALAVAANAADTTTVELLLDTGRVHADAPSREWGSALQAAIRAEERDTVELLLHRGADPNARGGKYGSPMDAAIIGWSEDMIELLLDHGAKPDRTYHRPKGDSVFWKPNYTWFWSLKRVENATE